MTLGNKIQALRKQQSLSQDAFAEIMAVTRQS
jgi:DNA-binding transcriptional regulator YiaG